MLTVTEERTGSSIPLRNPAYPLGRAIEAAADGHQPGSIVTTLPKGHQVIGAS